VTDDGRAVTILAMLADERDARLRAEEDSAERLEALLGLAEEREALIAELESMARMRDELAGRLALAVRQ
jgi:hypothetical protein